MILEPMTSDAAIATINSGGSADLKAYLDSPCIITAVTVAPRTNSAKSRVTVTVQPDKSGQVSHVLISEKYISRDTGYSVPVSWDGFIGLDKTYGQWKVNASIRNLTGAAVEYSLKVFGFRILKDPIGVR